MAAEEPTTEDPEFYFSEALFHQALDQAAQVYYGVEHVPPDIDGGPHLVTYAAGSAKWELVDKATGAVKSTVITPFWVAGAPYQMADYPPEGTTVSVQCKPPISPGYTAPPGSRYRRVSVYYDYAIIADLVTGAGAVARYDTDWPAQAPL